MHQQKLSSKFLGCLIGAAMRIAPVGLLYRNNSERLREVAHKASSITHSHELGKEGAALQAYAVALAVNTPSTEATDREVFILKLQKFAQNQLYKEKIASIRELLDEQDRLRVVAVLGNGIEAIRSVPTAIYCFLKQPRAYEDCVIYAISLGGEALRLYMKFNYITILKCVCLAYFLSIVFPRAPDRGIL